MVRSKELIRFEIDEKIRLERERAKLDMEVAEHEFKLERELEELRHKHTVEELKLYREVLPVVRDILKLQKELGVKTVALLPKHFEHVGKGIIKGLIEEKRKELKEKWK